jgi:hypothetical protein
MIDCWYMFDPRETTIPAVQSVMNINKYLLTFIDPDFAI